MKAKNATTCKEPKISTKNNKTLLWRTDWSKSRSLKQSTKGLWNKKSYLTSYKLYLVKTWAENKISEVVRRFSDFEWIYEKLIMIKKFLVPYLPQKNVFAKFNLEDKGFKKQRVMELEIFVQNILCHNHLRYNKYFSNFL